MTTEYKAVWIRIAGNSKRIRKNLSPPHWRYEIEGISGQHLLLGWTLQGQANPGNNLQGTKPAANGDEFLAWVKYYGNVVIDTKGWAVIYLLPVPEKQ